MPVTDTVATETLLLAQAPPAVEEPSSSVLPAHTLPDPAPVIADGRGFTLNVAVAMHPGDKE